MRGGRGEIFLETFSYLGVETIMYEFPVVQRLGLFIALWTECSSRED
jgi:hypothetical protein